MKTAIVNILIFLNVIQALKLPASFKKCDKQKSNFNECLGFAIRDAVKQLDKPMIKYGLASLEPIMLPHTVTIGNATGGLLQTYNNVRIYGHTKISDVKARMNFEKNILTLECSFPEIRHEADFETLGTILLLPSRSKGKTTSIYKNPIFILTFNLESYEKGNEQFWRIIKTDIDIKPEKLLFDFKNLFENEVLNAEFNAELNAKWKLIFADVKKQHLILYENLYGTQFDNLLEKVPIANFFDGV